MRAETDEGDTEGIREELEALRVLLARLNLAPTDLTTTDPPTPTFEQYVPQVAASVSVGTRRTYGPYWRQLVEHWPQRRLTEPTSTEIRLLAEHVKAQALTRRNSRGGRSAAEHFIAALRRLYDQAEADGLLSGTANPASRVPKPTRLPSTRRALSHRHLTEINHIAATTGNDPALDSLLLRFHTETACRRAGALTLRPGDLDGELCVVQLTEKGGTRRTQPVSPSLMHHLQAHIHHRHNTDPNKAVFRYRDGRPITRRRYDHLWNRIGDHLPWVIAQQISTHWIRHTTLTWVERHFGYAVARAYAGHQPRGHEPTATATYIRAEIEEVATALAALTGEAHPLAPESQGPSVVPRN
ncbi:tyrosine-type recombinase/integrase [Saccharopolyspora mangrovi]|uniref:Site-specific integrase n=1 Tax=Saccharopolyspora mangrovi TaxID=3082379 RepID=A0ABU6AIV9_9PSEU|nr:site-specific integrase [Saccharopolyspora sp. S2-29]MEB3371324.1 site-specific integrase [Saccharopolyspora sp. S2-29]